MQNVIIIDVESCVAATYTFHEKDYTTYCTHRRTVKNTPPASHSYRRHIYCLLLVGKCAT